MINDLTILEFVILVIFFLEIYLKAYAIGFFVIKLF